jgi:polar amino acid transport system substrate-binding protein
LEGLKTIITMILLKKIFWFASFSIVFSGCKNGVQDKSIPPFEFCVIEYDIPLSASKADEKTGLSGFYVNIGEAIAKELGRVPKPSFVMSAFMNRPIREGLLAGRCGAQIGLVRHQGKWLIPQKVQLTQAFGTVGYALVVPRNSPIQKAADLKGKNIAVQSGSPAHLGLDQLGGVSFHFFQFAEPAMKALVEGQVDAAMIWGPTAGYQNKYYYDNRFNVMPTNYSWPVAIALTAANDSLTTQIDTALEKLRPTIQKLVEDYGFPSGAVFAMPALPLTQPADVAKDDEH